MSIQTTFKRISIVAATDVTTSLGVTADAADKPAIEANAQASVVLTNLSALSNLVTQVLAKSALLAAKMAAILKKIRRK